MTRQARQIKRLIEKTRGRIFSVRFIKRTSGERRRMQARIGVYKPILARNLARRLLGQPESGGLQYDPDEKNLALVFDVVLRAYRMIDLNTVEELFCGEIRYKKENDNE